ncbi:MAG: caspase family protein [Paludibacteraceae bacterium]|nr:caspase family protein [Paludibacteraceae bacterium]
MKKIVVFIAILFSLFSRVSAEIYVVAVGISKYKNCNDLSLPDDDAKTIAALYKTKTENVITITGRYATRANIIKAMMDQFRRANSADMVVFFFSGHGYEGGLCPYDFDRGKNALSYEDIYAAFKQSKATRKIVMVDACMSGGLRHGKPQKYNLSEKRSDVVMFLSSRGREISRENVSMKNGFFTTYLDKGFRGGADANRDRIITAKELFNFVSKGVKNISKDKQHPVMWGNFDDNFIMMDFR